LALAWQVVWEEIISNFPTFMNKSEILNLVSEENALIVIYCATKGSACIVAENIEFYQLQEK